MPDPVTTPAVDAQVVRGPAYAAEFLGYDPADLAALAFRMHCVFRGDREPAFDCADSAGRNSSGYRLRSRYGSSDSRSARGPKRPRNSIDMIEAMRDRALNSAAAGLSIVEVHLADATMLPLPDASVDVVISNGFLNLVPEK